jgi:D-alanyl-D-alanine carboxypeptidase
MPLYMNTLPKWLLAASGILILVLLVTICFGYYHYSSELKYAQANLASTTESSAYSLKQEQDALTSEEAKDAQLTAELTEQKQVNASYGQQVGDLSTTVGDLSKLASIDPQLLAKYSKIYFLNENYVPAKLSNIDPQYVYGTNTLQFESDALPFLTQMIDAARAAGNDLSVISAYRSFGTQAMLKSSYKETFGAGTANSFSADQGYSEHQLGTAVDFTTQTVGDTFTGFNKTSAYAWLTANAYQYGFELSYPEGNTYYEYEPWHWRFVGVKLATMLHAENENFYDVDQRTINVYLIALFDPIVSTSTSSTN